MVSLRAIFGLILIFLTHFCRANGVSTMLGLMTNGFPNMFMLYGPQAPTSLVNGPPFLELEAEFVRDILVRLRDESLTTIDPKKEKEDAWRQQVLDLANHTLFIHSNSWYVLSHSRFRVEQH